MNGQQLTLFDQPTATPQLRMPTYVHRAIVELRRGAKGRPPYRVYRAGKMVKMISPTGHERLCTLDELRQMFPEIGWGRRRAG